MCMCLNFETLCIARSGAGHSFAEDPLVCSYMGTACTTTMLGQICQVLCKLHSSLGTWLASAMVSSSCLGILVSMLPCYLSVTYTDLSSVNNQSSLDHVRYVSFFCFV